MKNRRLVERFGIHEGDCVRLSVKRDVQGPVPDGEYIKEICGTVYQIYQDFVVIMTRVGTHPSYFWSDFEKWRVG
jgi:hypothetical protein